MINCKIQTFFLFISFTISSIGFCQSNVPNPNISDSNLENKKIDYHIPKPIGYVSDFERIFSIDEVTFLDSVIKDFENKTTIQIAIISIDTSMVSIDKFEDYTLQILRTWGVGQKDKNNGILIGISMGYRRIRIQNGYGIEKILSNEETKQIIDSNFIPNFKKGEMYNGTFLGLKAIMDKLK